MALNAYLRLKGETQGDIKGSAIGDHADYIMVIAVNHQVTRPVDQASGLTTTGKAQHSPLVITKEVDKSSPLLMHALATNERMEEVRLDFYRPTPSGQQTQFYTIELVDARIAGIEFEMLNNKYPENMQHLEREHVTLCYQRIIWTWQDGGITAEDVWPIPAR